MASESKFTGRTAWIIYAVGIFLIIILIGLAVPPVRDSLNGWLGLPVAPSSEVPVAAGTLEAAITEEAAGTEIFEFPGAAELPDITREPQGTQEIVLPVVVSGKPAEIVRLAAEAGWQIFAPEWLPADYTLQSAYYDATNQMAVVTYSATRTLPGSDETTTKTITLLQAHRNDFVPMEISPDSNGTDIEVKGQPAVLVVGAWDSQLIDDPNDPEKDLIVAVWRNDLPIRSIYWQDGQSYLVIMADDEAVSQEDLTNLANSTN